MADPEEIEGNRLLAALTDADWRRWRRHLERVDLNLGRVLYEPSTPPVYAYFPTSAIVSLLYLTGSGACAEFAIVGSEGVVSTSLFLGGATTTSHGLVLVQGQGFRIGAQLIKDEFDRSCSVRKLLLSYTQALVTQIGQTAVCNRRHTIDQQVCGWLLHSLDRLRHGEVVVTHELLASALGVRRESVTAAAGRLQAEGLIRYARGHISVLDTAGLARRSCECHAVVKGEYDRLLPHESRARPVNPARYTSDAQGTRHDFCPSEDLRYGRDFSGKVPAQPFPALSRSDRVGHAAGGTSLR